MGRAVEIRIPDIGEFENVEVVELIVSVGDHVEREQSLISIESDKATLEIPSPFAGVIRELSVVRGDLVSEGHVIARIELDEESPAERPSAAARRPAPAVESPSSAAAQQVREFPPSDQHAQVLVLGGGPGGYTAAFRAADLGKQVVLIERYPTLGGVCLNVGCIPSKALLHVAEVINDASAMRAHGVEFGEPRIDLTKLRELLDHTVGRLTKGLAGLARRRGVEVIGGVGRFSAPDQISVDADGATRTISFGDCIVAVGSRPVELPGLARDDPRVMNSTDALRLDDVPDRLLVIGGGIIGLELATVYHALGARIVVVELLDGLMPGCDRDLVAPLEKASRQRYENVFLSTRVTRIESESEGLRVFLEGGDAPESQLFDRVLVAVGRRPNSDLIDAEKAGLRIDEHGFIPTDARMQTTLSHVYAIGDVVGPPMLAHKATHEGKTAAEVIAGLPSAFQAEAIPSVAYTDPEVAWMGLTEDQARIDGTRFDKAVFPWQASGRALGIGRPEGRTKLLVDPETRRVLGAGIVGRGAGELISEAVLALEMGADAEDIALCIHPHPTLSETLAFAAEMLEGTITDHYAPRRDRARS